LGFSRLTIGKLQCIIRSYLWTRQKKGMTRGIQPTYNVDQSMWVKAWRRGNSFSKNNYSSIFEQPEGLYSGKGKGLAYIGSKWVTTPSPMDFESHWQLKVLGNVAL
jgi:hypothetical protein